MSVAVSRTDVSGPCLGLFLTPEVPVEGCNVSETRAVVEASDNGSVPIPDRAIPPSKSSTARELMQPMAQRTRRSMGGNSHLTNGYLWGSMSFLSHKTYLEFVASNSETIEIIPLFGMDRIRLISVGVLVLPTLVVGLANANTLHRIERSS